MENREPGFSGSFWEMDRGNEPPDGGMIDGTKDHLHRPSLLQVIENKYQLYFLSIILGKFSQKYLQGIRMNLSLTIFSCKSLFVVLIIIISSIRLDYERKQNEMNFYNQKTAI